MANRYWVASGSYDWHTAGNWSTTSGGAGGAGVPTSSDDVFFDGNGYSLCYVTSGTPVCNDFTMESTCNELVVFTVDFTVNGDFQQDADDFGFSGVSKVMEVKGDFTLNGGEFQMGTPAATLKLSGTTKTFTNDNSTGVDPTIKYLDVTGDYTFTGTEDPLFDVDEDFTISGDVNFNGNIDSVAGSFEVEVGGEFDLDGIVTLDGTTTIAGNCYVENTLNIDGDLTVSGELSADGIGDTIALDANFTSLTGYIGSASGAKSGKFTYYLTNSRTMPTGGTVNIANFYFYPKSGNTNLQIAARTWSSNTQVDFLFTTLATETYTFGAGTHVFSKMLKIFAPGLTTNGTFDCAANNAQFDIDEWRFDSGAFPSGGFTWKMGDNVHICRKNWDFFYSSSSSPPTTNLDIQPGDSTLIVEADAGIAHSVRLSRFYTGGIDTQTLNVIRCFQAPFITRNTWFLFEVHSFEFYLESDTVVSGAQFNIDTGSPQHIYQFDRLFVNGSKDRNPFFKARLAFPMGNECGINITERADIYGAKLQEVDFTYGDAVDAYNSSKLSDANDVTFYDRDIVRLEPQRNIFNARRILIGSQEPERRTAIIKAKAGLA
jgi:hypothetical protein